MKNVGTSVKVFMATKMKCAAASTLISLAFLSQAFAVLRPLFPAKPAPPFAGEVIIIGDDLVRQQQSNSYQWWRGIRFSKSNRNVFLSASQGMEDKHHGIQRYRAELPWVDRGSIRQAEAARKQPDGRCASPGRLLDSSPQGRGRL